MIKHYFKIAFRNILHDKTYSTINLLGLSVAIACCFLLIFWIKFEISFDAFNPKADRIYKVLQVEKRTTGLHKSDLIRPGIAHQLKDAFPEIEAAAVVHHEKLPFSYEDQEGILVDYVNTTADYLDLFPYEFTEGSRESVLQSQGSIMTEEVARKFFGNESAIGKKVSFAGSLICTVMGVVKMPPNTHLKFDILSFDRSIGYGINYVLIKDNVRFSEKQLRRLANFLSTTRETDHKLTFLPLRDTHLHSPQEIAGDSNWQTFGDLKQIYLFSFAALLILLIAIINYINTSTARAITRMKEVGIRKVTGSTQRQLILRFLSEAFLISFASVLLALVAAKLFFPEFSMIMGNQTRFVFDPNTIVIALSVCLVITLLSGGYAAFYLSSFDPSTVLRGGMQPGSKEGLRKILITLQFFLAIGILICTSFIYKQIHFMFNADTGVDKKNIIVLDTSLWYQVESFIKVIKQENPNIIDATIAYGAPYNVEYGYSGVSWEGSPDAVKEVEFAQAFCDYHYAHTFGLKMLEGEFIQPGWGWWQNTDDKSYNIVVNEAFTRLMGMNNPVGTTVKYDWGIEGKIIGVVKDFNFKPLKEPITPLIICYNPEACNKVYIKTTGKNPKETLEYILKKYKEMFAADRPDLNRPIMYHTVEDDFNAMYKNELRTAKMLTVFSIISLCLSIMGIFGMVSFMIEKRTKEIAIRKINGAETKDVIVLFIKDFARLIGIASAVAIPVSFVILYNWIQTYAYRTTLSWWIFAGVAVLVFLITSGLIAIQVLLTTRQNPVESLRSE